MDGLQRAACVRARQFLLHASVYVSMRVFTCAADKVKQPLNKFKSVTHWGLTSPSISADRMARLYSMHAAHCGL